MKFLCLKYLVHSAEWRVERRAWKIIFFVHFRRNLLSVSFFIYFEIVSIWHMYHSFNKRIFVTITFLPFKESLTLFQYDSFYSRIIVLYYFFFTYFIKIGVIKERITKIDSKHFNRVLWPLHSSCLINAILYPSAHEAWLLKSLYSILMYLHIVLKLLLSC